MDLGLEDRICLVTGSTAGIGLETARLLAAEGARVVVGRLWPHGIKKSDARLEAWLRGLAPSDALRKWFHEKGLPEFFPEFRRRYLHELSRPAASAALNDLYRLARSHSTVTLI